MLQKCKTRDLTLPYLTYLLNQHTYRHTGSAHLYISQEQHAVIIPGHNQCPPPPHSVLIYPWCPECPSHSANFKKLFNCVKVVMFGAMIFVLLCGGINSSHYIHARFCDDKYKLHHEKLWQTVLGLLVYK